MGFSRFEGRARRRAARGLRALMADATGGPMMEFAFVGPMFIAMVIAILQIALVFLAQEGLETAAEAGARYLLTGQAQNASWTPAQFKTQVCTALPAFLQCSRTYVDVASVTSYSTASTTLPSITGSTSTVSTSSTAGGTCTTSTVTNTADSNGVKAAFNFCTGTQGAIVVVRVMYLWPTITGPLGFTLATSGNSRLIMATSVLKTEGYTTSTS